VCICDDGHDVELLLSVIAMATSKNTTKNNNAPTAIFIRVLPGSGSSSLEKHPNIPALLFNSDEKITVLKRRLERLAKGAGNFRVKKLSARAQTRTPNKSSRPSSRMAAASTPTTVQNANSVTAPATSTLTASLQEIERIRNEKHVTINDDPNPKESAAINEIIVIDARRIDGRCSVDKYNYSSNEATSTATSTATSPFVTVDVAAPGSLSCCVGFGLGATTEGKRVVVIGTIDGWSAAGDALKCAGFTLKSSGKQHQGPTKKKPDPRAESTKKRALAMKTNDEHHRALRLAGIAPPKGPERLKGLESRGSLILLSVAAGSRMGSFRGWGEMVYDDISLFNRIHGCVIFCPCDLYSAKTLMRLVLTLAPKPPANWRLFYVRTDDAEIGEEMQDMRESRAANGSVDTAWEDQGEEKRGGGEKDADAAANEECCAVAVYNKRSTSMVLPPTFRIGGSNVLKRSFEDQLTLLACGSTCVRNSLLAYDELLSTYGVVVRVVDLYCLKPVDKHTVLSCFTETRFLVTVENHGIVGGVSHIVSSICPVERSLASNGVHYSGTQQELERDNKHDVGSIVNAVIQVLSKDQGPMLVHEEGL
jgi:transketolase C-terminal domain/subunit